MMNSLSISASAFKAFGVRQQVAANNVANMNTDGFKASRVGLEERPGRQGVSVQEIRKDTSSGPLDGQDKPGAALKASGRGDGRADGNRAESGPAEGSNTDLVQEMVTMIENENGYAANATAVQTQTRMVGEFLNRQV
jgi:flagellar basal-body rod protein FlgC